MALVCCSFFSGLRWCHAELQGLQCSLVDRDPGTEARPVVTHDLELSRDGLKLGPGSVFNFYCELFHISFIVVQAQGALRLITSEPTWANNDLTNLSSGKSLNELRLYPIISGTGCQACSLLLVAFFFHNFFHPGSAG